MTSSAIKESMARTYVDLAKESSPRVIITNYSELNVNNFEQVKRTHSLLTDRKSVWHFVSHFESPRDLQRFAKREDIHVLVFFDHNGDIVSTSSVEDGPETKTTVVGSNEISRIAVDSGLQRPIDQPSTESPGIGMQTMIHTLRYAFNTLTYSKRSREDVYIWITKMAGWERMYTIAKKAGFQESMEGTPVIKKWPDGSESHHEAIRLDILRGRFMTFENEGYYEEILAKLDSKVK